MQDALEDDLVGRQALEARGGVGGGLGLHALVLGDEARQGVLAAREDQVVGQFHLVGGNLPERTVVRGVDHRQVQPGIHGPRQENAVQRGAGRRAEAERHVAHAEARVDARQVLLDEADALDGGGARVTVLVLSRGKGEGERIEDEALGGQPVLIHHDVVDLPGNGELGLGGLGHAVLIDRQRDHGGTVLLHDGHHALDALATVLHVDGVHDHPTGVGIQRGGDGVRLGAVDHQGRLDAHGQLLREDGQLLGLVGALGEGHAHVQHVGAELHLLAGHGEGPVVVVREDHLLDLAAALRVDPLAHDGGAGLLAQVDAPHGAGDPWLGGHLVHVRGHIPQRGDERADVVGRGAAAAAHHVGPVVAHHRGHLRGHLVRAQVVVRLAAHVPGESRVRHHGDGLSRVAAHVRHRLAQVLGADRAVGADDVGTHALEDGDDRANVGAQQHAPGLVERHLRLDRHRRAQVIERQPDSVDGRARLQDVLLGLDQQHVGAALHQARGLNADLLRQLIEGDARQLRVVGAGQHACGPDGADDEPGDAVGRLEIVTRTARVLRGGHVDVGDEFGQVATVGPLPLLQAQRGRLERVGLHRLRARFEVCAVDLLDQVGTRDGEVIHGTFQRPATVVIGGEVACLDLRAHPAVEDHDAITEGR